jgi:hypothetical protein
MATDQMRTSPIVARNTGPYRRILDLYELSSPSLALAPKPVVVREL